MNEWLIGLLTLVALATVMTAAYIWTIRPPVAYNEAGARSGIHYNTINHVVDVRSQEEWDYGHYSGAYHIPVRNIPSALPRTLPDRSKSLLFYGGVGGDRAYKAARLAQDLGYNTVGYLEQGDYKGLEHLNPPTRG